MIVCIDCNVLVAWSTTKADSLDKARLDNLFQAVVDARGKIIVPTPALAEFLVKTGESTADWLASIERRKAFEVVPFDRRAAFECALMDRAALGSGDKKSGATVAWQKIKIDRQILAAARARNATNLITGDTHLAKLARALGLAVNDVSELTLPESAKQIKLGL